MKIFQVKQIHEWLIHWNANFLSGVSKGKGKKQSDSGPKKAILLSGTPGIGKTTSAKLVSQMLGFQTIEVCYHRKVVFFGTILRFKISGVFRFFFFEANQLSIYFIVSCSINSQFLILYNYFGIN